MPTQRLVVPGPKRAEDLSAAVEQLFREQEAINLRLSNLEYELKRTLYAAPAKPREGMFAKADGVTWNPGAGAGLYQYVGGAWVKL